MPNNANMEMVAHVAKNLIRIGIHMVAIEAKPTYSHA